MNRASIYNGGADCRAAFGDYITATAAGTGDATEANGEYVNREDSDGGMAMSAKLIIAWEATLTATKTLTLTANIQDASDSSGTGVADFGTALAATVVGTATGTSSGVVELDFDLSEADQYLRTQITPDLSNTATDTCNIVATWVFFGHQRGPVSNSLI